MNLRRLGQLFILASLLLALVSACSVQKYVSRVEASYGEKAKVIVAAKPIKARTAITAEALDYQIVPLQALMGGMILEERKGDLVGRTALVDIAQGSVLTLPMVGTGKLSDPNLRRYILTSSERVITPADLVTDDEVDLLASYKEKDGAQVSRIVLSGLKVLEARAEERRQVVVLEVTTQQAETLAWHENFGQQLRLLRR